MLIFIPFWMKCLILINKDDNIKQICARMGCDYAHTYNIIKELSRIRLINYEKDGRSSIINLTTMGIKCRDGISVLKDSFPDQFYNKSD